jgi:methylated-DNA-protein-cysteine methyltransferase-like protein
MRPRPRPDHDRPSPAVTAIAATVRRVPRGRVSTYGAIAKAAGYPGRARFVGYVLRTVPGLPWQRILGSGGRIAVPGEYAMEQRFLLEAEGVRFRGRRADLRQFEHQFDKPPARAKAAKSTASRKPVGRPSSASRKKPSKPAGKVHPKL